MPCRWCLIRQKQLSMAANAWLVFECVTCFNFLKGVAFVVKCLPIPIKNTGWPTPRGSWKLNDPPLTKGSKTDGPPPLCSGPPPRSILFDQSLISKEMPESKQKNAVREFSLMILKCESANIKSMILTRIFLKTLWPLLWSFARLRWRWITQSENSVDCCFGRRGTFCISLRKY